MRYAAAAMVMVVSLCLSETMTQTDWSGGPGETEPVAEWLSAFKAGSGISYDQPGELGLGISILPIDTNLVHQYSGYVTYTACADFDGDGDMDIVANDANDWKVFFYENIDGSGQEWEKHHIFSNQWPPARCIRNSDVDQDGDMDLIIASGFYFTYWENADGSGLSWNDHVLADNPDWEAFDMLCFDIDQDGDNDLVGSSSYGCRLLSWENIDGSGNQWMERVITDDYLYGTRISSCDLEGDGDIDLVCTWKNSETVVIHMNQGEHMWVDREVVSSIYEPKNAQAADFDGDGDMDVVVFSQTTRRIYENLDGEGNVWDFHTLPPVAGPINYKVSTGDIDLDGDIDIYGTLGRTIGSPVNSAMFIYENVDGTCAQWEGHRLAIQGSDLSAFMSCGDINGDGYPDFPGTNRTTEDMLWLDIIGPADTGWVESSILQVSDPLWENLTWSADLPSGSDIYFQLRASDDWENMGSWSDPIEDPGSISGIMEDGDQYVQYMATLTRSESPQEPSLLSVSLTWLLGLEGTDPAVSGLFIQSPTRGSVTAEVIAESPSSAHIVVYDMSGRAVTERTGRQLEEGLNEVSLGEMAPGVYFCRLTLDGSDTTARFVVIR